MMLEDIGTKEHEEIDVVIEEEARSASQEEALKYSDEELQKRELKKIAVTPVSDYLKKDAIYLLTEMEALCVDVAGKYTYATEQNTFIKNKVDTLSSSQDVVINREEYQKSEESVEKYLELLKGIIAEIQNEMSYFIVFLKDKTPQYLIVPQDDTDSFELFFAQKTRVVKKYIKDMKKDLNISYSRYCFGFEAQINRMAGIEYYLQMQQGRKVSTEKIKDQEKA